MFKSKEKELEKRYRYGVVKELIKSRDGKSRTVVVEYQNSEEKVKRTTKRGVRELVLIQHLDEVGVMHELHKAASSEQVQQE